MRFPESKELQVCQPQRAREGRENVSKQSSDIMPPKMRGDATFDSRSSNLIAQEALFVYVVSSTRRNKIFYLQREPSTGCLLTCSTHAVQR